MTRSGESPVMIGRVGPLARLVGLVEVAEVASGDEPSIGLVSGEPGIGKTRLINEFAENPTGLGAADKRVSIDVIRAQPGSLERPFDAVAALLDNLRAEDDSDPHRVVLDAFHERLAKGPAVLVVEDVHWIDADSAALVDRLSRQPWPALVIVGSYRSGALRRGSPGGELVSRLERGHTTEQIRLDRLDRHEVAALVNAITGEQPTSAVVDAVVHRSEGVPFVVEELVRAVRPERGVEGDGDDVAAAISSIELPWSLNDAVRQQLAGLRDDERRLVEALAIFDDIASFDTIQVVTELAPDALLAALRDLVGDGVIDEVGDDRFWFAHALTADTIAGGLLGRETRRLHERCLVALRGSDEGTDHAALVRHALGAGRFDEVAELARTGARKALEKGRTFLALRLASQGLAEECDDPELLAIATEAAWRLDFLDEAAVHATHWVSYASGPSRVDALRMLSRVAFERNELELADTALAQLVVVAEGNGDPLAVRAAAEAALAQLYMFSHRTDDAVRWADRAIVHANASGDALSAVRAAVERASARSWLVPRDQARRELRTAIDAARDAKDFISTARGLSNLLVVVPEHSVEGQAIVDELQELVRRAGFDKLGAVAAIRTCERAIGLGDLAATRRSLAESWSSWMRVGIGEWVTVLEAFIAIEEGRHADAQEVLRSITAPGSYLAAVVAVNDGPFDVPILWLTLGALSADQRLGTAAFDEVAAIESTWSLPFSHLVVVVDAALGVGVPSARVRDRIVDGHVDSPAMLDDARSYLEGLIAVAERRHRDAVALLEPLVGGEIDESIGATTRAVLRMALARAHLGVGDRARALAAVDAVIESDLARWPGVRRDRAEELRRRLVPGRADSAARAANAADSGPGGELTRREREVAGLLSDGLTNGQLAERLFISPKTAAVHVSNILAKLGLSSRAEIAAWAVRNLGELTAVR